MDTISDDFVSICIVVVAQTRVKVDSTFCCFCYSSFGNLDDYTFCKTIGDRGIDLFDARFNYDNPFCYTSNNRISRMFQCAFSIDLSFSNTCYDRGIYLFNTRL